MSRGRDYETAIAESPVRHAIFNKPFTLLRKRTEVLLDTITGGTLSPDVIETERKQKEADRSLKCRGCRVLFGDEKGLTRHHNLFPAHIHPPEHKSKSKAKRRPHRSHSTPNALSSFPASSPTRNHVRAETEANGQTTWSPVTASDFYVPPPVITNHETLPSAPAPAPALTPEYEPVSKHIPPPIQTYSPVHRPLPPIPTTQSHTQETDAVEHSIPAAPIPAPLLPSFEFGSFKVISQEGEIEPISKPRRVEKEREADFALVDVGKRNIAAGQAAAAAKLASLQDAKKRQNMTRGGSESALDKMTMPSTFGEVVRAVVATGATGAAGGAVSPLQSPTLTKITSSTYVPLGDKEEVPSITERKRANSGSWSNLLTALPGAPEEKKEVKVKEIKPIKTGLTSFSSSEDQASPSASPTSPISFRRLPRRNTNPFLNESFMSTLSPTKTPPLTPSSPFASRSLNGNPFARLSSQDQDSDDDFRDAPETPAAEYGQVTNRISMSGSKNPFFESMDTNNNAVSPIVSSKRAETEGLGLSDGQSRNVRFHPEAALKASDNPRCPSCRQVFTELEGVLDHLDRSECNPYDASEGQAIFAGM